MLKTWSVLGLGLALLLMASAGMAQETTMPEPVAISAFDSAPLDVALNADGSMAYVAFADGTLGVYAVGADGTFAAVGEPVAANGISFQPIRLALSPDGSMLYVANSGFVGRSLLSPITLWSVDAVTGMLTAAGRWSLPSSGNGLTGIAISADGTHLSVAGAFENAVAVLPLETPAQTVTVEVAPYKQPCVGVGPMLCSWVSIDGGDWQFFYNGIAGFDFQWGHSYTLTVSVEQVANPPADGSSLRYSLISVDSDSGYQSGLTFEMQMPTVLVQPVSDGLFSLGGEIEFTCADPLQCSALGTFLSSNITPPTVFTFPETEGDPLVADITLLQR